MKKVYEVPEQEIVAFEVEDVITTSQHGGMTDAGVGDWGDGDEIDFGDLVGR